MKKPRRIENSHSSSSSVECDSRNFNGGNFSEEEDESDQHNQSSSSAVEDPLIESTSSLQGVQEALQQEVKKIAEIGNEPFSHDGDDDSSKLSCAADKSCLSGQSEVEDKQISSSSLELQILSLTENINILESKSEELQDVLSLKDSRIAELEIALTGDESRNEESTCVVRVLDKTLNKVESELESLFKQKVEAEVEYLIITKMMQSLKTTSAFMLLAEQETMPVNQVQIPNNLEEAHSEGSIMKTRADEQEKICADILQVEESFMIQRRVCKLTFFLFLQFMWLIFAISLVMWPFHSDYGVVIPT